MATQGTKTQTEQLLDTLDTLASKFERRIDAKALCPMCGKPIGAPFHSNHADTHKDKPQ